LSLDPTPVKASAFFVALRQNCEHVCTPGFGRRKLAGKLQ
jgi:hypothetical protein